jgi:hypothetical protein
VYSLCHEGGMASKFSINRGRSPRRSVQLEKAQEESPANSNMDPKNLKSDTAASRKRKFKLPASLQWIPANWTWSKIKPVIRCALSAWIAAIFFIIPRVQIFLGNVRSLNLYPTEHYLTFVVSRLVS